MLSISKMQVRISEETFKNYLFPLFIKCYSYKNEKLLMFF